MSSAVQFRIRSDGQKPNVRTTQTQPGKVALTGFVLDQRLRGILLRGAGVALLLVLCLLQPLAAAAHGDPDERITALTDRIALDQNDARLFLKRGRLFRVAEHDEGIARL